MNRTSIQMVSLITCQECGHTLKPKQGDYCVYCSCGTSICPPDLAAKLGRDYQSIVSEL